MWLFYHFLVFLLNSQVPNRQSDCFYKTEELITMYESILGNTSLLATSYSFENKVTYKYEACIRTNCQNVTDVVTADTAKAKKLLVLKGRLNVDNNSSFAR